MLRPRIIPCLLLSNKGLVKTTNFKDPKYVGDPINAVRIFNEKECDELMFLDINSTVDKSTPDLKLIKKIAAECRMPLCYGGGVKDVETAIKIFYLGVEKIALSSAVIQRPKLISEISKQVGNQSVVVVLDVKKNLFGGYDIYTHNGKIKSKQKFFDFINLVQEMGAGEIVINSIEKDGKQMGYDLKLVEKVMDKVKIPLSIVGGAGSFDDFKKLFSKYPIIGASAGSFFVFNGKYRAVLISYPNKEIKESLFCK